MTLTWDAPPPRPKPSWSVRLPLELLAFALLAQMLAAQALLPEGGRLAGWRIAVPISASYLLLLAFIRVSARARFGVPLRELPGFGATTRRRRWLGIAVGVALYGFNLAFASVVELGVEKTDLYHAVGGYTDLLALVIPVAVLAPVFEEILFRGFFYGAFERHGRGVAIGLSALIFGVVHLFTYANAPLAVVPVFAVGLANGWLRDRTNALDACITSHAAFNLLGLASWAAQLAANG